MGKKYLVKCKVNGIETEVIVECIFNNNIESMLRVKYLTNMIEIISFKEIKK